MADKAPAAEPTADQPEATKPEPEKVPAPVEAKKPEPVKLAPVPDVPAVEPAAPSEPDPALDAMRQQLKDQGAALAELQKQLQAERAAAEKAREQARAQRRLQYLASINGGLHSEHYASLAPSDADADTDEGKATLKEWAKTNTALFRGVHGAPTQQAQFQTQHPTFAGRAIKTAAELLGLNKGGGTNG